MQNSFTFTPWKEYIEIPVNLYNTIYICKISWIFTSSVNTLNAKCEKLSNSCLLQNTDNTPQRYYVVECNLTTLFQCRVYSYEKLSTRNVRSNLIHNSAFRIWNDNLYRIIHYRSLQNNYFSSISYNWQFDRGSISRAIIDHGQYLRPWLMM